MSEGYDPRSYWEDRLATERGLRGTGHISFSEGYNQWLYRAKLRTLGRAIGSTAVEGRSVLDVGCGTGFFVDWYRQRGATVAGVDITNSSIESLRQRFNGDFRVLDISATDTKSIGQFDIVNVWDVMYHIVDEAAFKRAVQFSATSVKPGGLLLITDQLGAQRNSRPAEHVSLRCLGSYQDALAGAGFEFAGLHFLYRWLNRYVTIPPVDNALGWLYFWLDGMESRIPSERLSLGVWRRIAQS